MALRDQPYIPLYVQDFLTDEKLNECSAASQGVYIKIMCILHKQEDYGKILLRQKDQQNPSKIKNFAYKFAKLLPFPVDVIESALVELVEEKVLTIDGDTMFQKRMVKDGEISIKRSQAALSKPICYSKSDSKTEANSQAKQLAKAEQNSEYENEDEDVIVSDNESGDTNKTVKEKYPVIYSDVICYLNEKAGTSYKPSTKSTQEHIRARQTEGFTLEDFKRVIDNKCAEWLNDPKMKQYLRPETLFSIKFEWYLNNPKLSDRRTDLDEILR